MEIMKKSDVKKEGGKKKNQLKISPKIDSVKSERGKKRIKPAFQYLKFRSLHDLFARIREEQEEVYSTMLKEQVQDLKRMKQRKKKEMITAILRIKKLRITKEMNFFITTDFYFFYAIPLSILLFGIIWNVTVCIFSRRYIKKKETEFDIELINEKEKLLNLKSKYKEADVEYSACFWFNYIWIFYFSALTLTTLGFISALKYVNQNNDHDWSYYNEPKPVNATVVANFVLFGISSPPFIFFLLFLFFYLLFVSVALCCVCTKKYSAGKLLKDLCKLNVGCCWCCCWSRRFKFDESSGYQEIKEYVENLKKGEFSSGRAGIQCTCSHSETRGSGDDKRTVTVTTFSKLYNLTFTSIDDSKSDLESIDSNLIILKTTYEDVYDEKMNALIEGLKKIIYEMNKHRDSSTNVYFVKPKYDGVIAEQKFSSVARYPEEVQTIKQPLKSWKGAFLFLSGLIVYYRANFDYKFVTSSFNIVKKLKVTDEQINIFLKLHITKVYEKEKVELLKELNQIDPILIEKDISEVEEKLSQLDDDLLITSQVLPVKEKDDSISTEIVLRY